MDLIKSKRSVKHMSWRIEGLYVESVKRYHIMHERERQKENEINGCNPRISTKQGTHDYFTKE